MGIVICGALLFRHRLSFQANMWITTAVLFLTAAIGIYQEGLASPSLLGLVVLPIVNAVIWGIWLGVTTLVFAVASLLIVAYFYLFAGRTSVLDLETFHQSPLNWAVAAFGMVVCAIWGIWVADLQRQHWKKALKELREENRLREESEARKRELEAHWQSIAQSLPAVIFTLVLNSNRKYEMRSVSEGSQVFWGIDPKDIETDIQILLSLLDAKTKTEIEAALLESKRTMLPLNLRFMTTSSEGAVNWFQASARPLPASGGEIHWHCIAVDITREVAAENDARKQTELAQQAQRQKSVGQLTAGVAHDFNNILAVILGNLELLKDDQPDGEAVALIDKAINASEKGADLTRNMLAFSRQSPLKPKILDLNEVVRTSSSWMSRAIPNNCDVETYLKTGLWKTKVDESSVASAILNLLVNARDALPDGGKITIETSNVRIDEDYIGDQTDDIEPGRYVLLAVSDNGVGISKSDLETVFEPFFTTKEPGKGTGLGLAMVHGFMRQSKGKVAAYSETGVGTTIKLYFPAYMGEADAAAPISHASNPEPTKGARLLLVEDETQILEMLQKTLCRAGYEIVAASSGDQAAAIFSEDSHFDLLITDIVMPGNLQGTTLARALRAIRPDLPAIFMSGYARESTVHGNGLRSDDIRLMKPVSRQHLLSAIEQALGKAKT
ncbi:ATP-binding protein [Shimia sp. NS0008-38b]|uniref:ATP-binding protein n=1 Tax=Shimia sp. NS0008-38b TaxID=3127653 RepID=UPI0033427412